MTVWIGRSDEWASGVEGERGRSCGEAVSALERDPFADSIISDALVVHARRVGLI